MSVHMSKYEKAIRAANKKDATELSWELIKVVLMDLNSGVDGELKATERGAAQMYRHQHKPR